MQSAAALAAFGLLFLKPGAAGAEDAATPATYRGRIIDLAESWEGATACAVLTEEDIRCFDSEAELQAALATDGIGLTADSGHVGAAAACSGFVTLYDDVSFGGPSIGFASTAYWLNLVDYGFNNKMESWRNNRNCPAYVAASGNGGGSQLVLASNSEAAAVSSDWKNRASSILS